MLTGSGILYVLFSESSLQPWNSVCHPLPETGLKELQNLGVDREDEEEKKPLKSDHDDAVAETETKTKSVDDEQ